MDFIDLLLGKILTYHHSLTPGGNFDTLNLPFSHKSVVSITLSRILFAAKHLFVGSHLQVKWWALGQ